MRPVAIVAIFAAAIVLSSILLGPATPLSLATDVGYTDEDVCQAVDAQGSAAIHRLEETLFPHATDRPVEVYRLLREGEPMAAVRIDWRARTATCLPLDEPMPATVDIAMSKDAYGVLVRELRSVIITGGFASPSIASMVRIAWGTSTTVHTSEDEGASYKWALAKWAAGVIGRWGT